jgi:hypothetical protein
MNYPRPANGSKRWMHWTASCYPCHNNYRWHLDRMVKANISGVKYLSDGNGNVGVGDSGLQFGVDVLARGMIPVVRYYMNAEHRWSDANSYATEANVRAGIVYIETLNEPDLALEHDSGSLPKDWLRRAFDNWIDHAHHILALGGIPLSPALASGAFGDRGQPTVAGQVRENPFVWVKQAGITRFVCSMHNYTLCHPVDYPNDSVNMYGTPLTVAERERTGGDYAWDSESLSVINARRMHDKNGPEASIEKDDSCFRACELFRRLLNEAGLPDVPVLTTEGGPVLTDRQDGRYPRVTPIIMQEMIEQELAYMAKDPLYLGYAWWLWANNAAGGTGGWSTCQWFWPGGPFSDSEGFIPAYRFLCDRPLSADGNPTPPAPPPTPEPEPPEEEPVPEPIVVNDAASYGVTIMPCSVTAGEKFWQCIKVHHLTPAENSGNHNLFADVLNASGQRINGAKVQMMWPDGRTATAVIDKPANEPGTNMPLWKADVVDACVLGEPMKSDVVTGLSTNHPDEPPARPGGDKGNTLYHHSFLCVWQLATASGAPPPPEPPVTPGDGWSAQDAADLLELRAMLDRADTLTVAFMQRHS